MPYLYLCPTSTSALSLPLPCLPLPVPYLLPSATSTSAPIFNRLNHSIFQAATTRRWIQPPTWIIGPAPAATSIALLQAVLSRYVLVVLVVEGGPTHLPPALLQAVLSRYVLVVIPLTL